jgi:hypothetical protein
VLVDIMYINDLSTERRVEESVKHEKAVNYHRELDLLSSNKKGAEPNNNTTRFSNITNTKTAVLVGALGAQKP